VCVCVCVCALWVLSLAKLIMYVCVAGDTSHPPLHKDFQLEQWQHLLPHDHWQPSAWQ